jgi:ribosomal protein S18 acetylase RimI-like enzyme
MRLALAEAMARCVEFQRRFERARAGRAVRCAHGDALFNDDLPRVFDLNFLSVDLGASVSAAELEAEADAIQGAAGLAHRKIAIDDELGSALAPGFRELGWLVNELVVMPHRRQPPPVDLSTVEEVDADELVPVWASWMRRDPEVGDEEMVRQLVEAQLRRSGGTRICYFATRVEGRIASYCELFSDGRSGQIESVMAGEEFRGRGLGKAVVAGALAASQAVHEFTFIVADADDWPKELYSKLGFEAAGSTFSVVRRPDR